MTARRQVGDRGKLSSQLGLHQALETGK